MLKCEVCEKREVVKIPNVETILRCQNCGFGRLKDIPKKKRIKEIYKKEYFNDKKGEEYWLDSVRKYNYFKKYLKKNSAILDFGCGMGQFASLAKKNGHRVLGFDVSEYSKKYVREKYSIKVKTGDFHKNNFKANSFNAIFAFDVIEHTTEYRKMVACFYEWLKRGGLLVISTPNISSWDQKLFKSKWWGYSKQKEHLVYFSPDSIKIIVEKTGFKVDSIKNWGFVRSLMFVFNNIFKKTVKFNILHNIMKLISAEKIYIYFPMHNMIIIARK